ncbi:hypothetical protein K9B40_25365, partial [Klebsiella aerogenes]|nr:hypothetical protein [Klebsiella aerogenes]
GTDKAEIAFHGFALGAVVEQDLLVHGHGKTSGGITNNGTSSRCCRGWRVALGIWQIRRADQSVARVVSAAAGLATRGMY